MLSIFGAYSAGKSGISASYRKKHSEKEILKGNYYINIKDQDGNIVTQREISQKEKEAIMRFLHEKTAIVVNQRFFNIAKHLYEDGNLFAIDKSIYADPEDNQERDKKRR